MYEDKYGNSRICKMTQVQSNYRHHSQYRSCNHIVWTATQLHPGFNFKLGQKNIFCSSKCPHWLWGPPSLLFHMYQETKGNKLAEWHRKADTLPSVNDKCKQNIRDKIEKRKWLKQRYLHSSVHIKCSDNWIFCLRTGLLMHGIKVKVVVLVHTMTQDEWKYGSTSS